MQGTQVQSLIEEHPTYLRSTQPVHHDCWAFGLEPRSHNCWAHSLQLLKPLFPRACAWQWEKPPQWEDCVLQPESSPYSNEDPAQTNKGSKIIRKKKMYYGSVSLSCFWFFQSFPLSSSSWVTYTDLSSQSLPLFYIASNMLSSPFSTPIYL